MRQILRHRGLRLVFTANLVSMLGSGMNSAAVTWYILQATHSEVSLGWLTVLQTIPAMLLMPFAGVLIDREDRRKLVMVLDSVRGLIIFTVAVLAFTHRVQVWQLYLMNVLVATGFWMFWPTITALIQELTPDAEYVHSSTLLMAGVQGGWLMAGALVGFVYNHIGLGGVLLIDSATYVVSFACYLTVRKGHHVVRRASEQLAEIESAVGRYFHEMREGLGYLRANRRLTLLGMSWALFIGGMLASGVVTAPLSDRILKGGAVGYGWLNGSWGVGAFLSVVYVPLLIKARGSRHVLVTALAVLAGSMYSAPFSRWLVLGALLYWISGSARGASGIALSSNLMELVPHHLIGRVQNIIYCAATGLQVSIGLVVGIVAHRAGLAPAFAIIGTMYLLASVAAAWPLAAEQRALQASQAPAD